VFYVVRRSKPGRFRLSATLLKLVSIDIEADAQDKPDELPGSQPETGGSDLDRPARVAVPTPA